MLRVHIAISHPAVRQALAAYLRENDGFEVVGVSTEGMVGAAASAADRPDVILVSEPATEPYAAWIETYRTAAPGAKVVMVLVSRPPSDLEPGHGADAVVDGALGAAAVAEAVCSLPGR